MSPRRAPGRFSVSRAWIRALAALGLACALPLVLAPLRAEVSYSVPTAAGSEVAIKVAMVPAQPPRFGFAPVRVTIENTAQTERTWRFVFQSGVRATFPGLLGFERAITVPAGQTRDTWLYVPVAEPGTPGGEPTLAGGGGTASGSTPIVSITRTLAGTSVIRTTPSPVPGGPPLFVEMIILDNTTGEMKTTTTGAGGVSQTRSSMPPAGSAVTYRIDGTTGQVTSGYSPAIPGAQKVTIVTTPGRPGAIAMPSSRVQIDPTPVGMRVTRQVGNTAKGSRGYSEEREIDSTTGVITTTTTSASGAVSPLRTTAPLGPGTETTYTINSNTGSISTTTRIGSNPSAPPKINIITSAVSSPGVASTRAKARMMTANFNGPPMTLSFDVIGPGVSGTRLTFAALGSTANMRPWAASGGLERLLRESLNREGIPTPNLTSVDAARLPADWRLWSSFAAVFLPADEYATLDAAHRAALRGWVALGGQLYLAPAQEGARTIETLGAGTIVTLASPLTVAPTAEDLQANGITLGSTPGHPDSESLLMRAASALGVAAMEKPASTTWLTIFLLAFAGIVGPLNLYLLAPADKRHRLFITTPLISLGGALILGLVILGQDGTGGAGLRRALVVFLPGENQAAVFQEQASTTGFLANQSFALAGDTQITALPIEDYLLGRPNFNGASTVTRDDIRAAGDWFRNRGRQAHLLQRLTPTRSRVERVGTASGGAPIVQSSLAGVLKDFVCVDEAGDLWTTRELAPGRRVTLERGGKWVENMPLGGTRRFSAILAAAAPQQSGRWGAKGVEGELAPLPTHTGVRWGQLEVIYTGALEGVAVEKGGAR